MTTTSNEDEKKERAAVLNKYFNFKCNTQCLCVKQGQVERQQKQQQPYCMQDKHRHRSSWKMRQKVKVELQINVAQLFISTGDANKLIKLNS